MTQLLRLLPIALLLAFSGCGGRTGLLVTVAVPPDFRPGEHFNALQVQVVTPSTEVIGNPPTPITAESETPYRVIVWLGEQRQTTVTILVRLLKDGASEKEAREPNVTFEPGVLKDVTVTIL